MASNSPFSSGSGISSLLKGAASRARTIADFDDSIEASNYAQSAYTDEAYVRYKRYLDKRIKSLTVSSAISDQQKALTLTNTLRSAARSNTSASITRENIQIMTGNHSLTDKYNLVSGQFQRAIRNGDYTLAQSLESQAYSISQQIQQQADQAARAGAALSKAGGSSSAKGYEGVAKGLEGKLKQFTADFRSVGKSGSEKLISNFLKSPTVTKQMKALGINLPSGAQPNYYDIVEGIAHAIYQAHSLASQAVEPYNADQAQTYADKANAIVSGNKTFSVLGGSLTLQELQHSATALSKGQLAYNATTGGFGTAPIPNVPKGSRASGFAYVPGTGVVTNVSPGAFVETPQGLPEGLKSLGLTHGSKVTDGVQAQVTEKSPEWLKKTVGQGTLINVFVDNLGNLQFKGDSTQGTGKAVYTVVKDPSGKKAIYESSAMGDKLVSGDTGFDAYPSLQSHEGFFGHLLGSGLNAIEGAASSLSGLFGSHVSAQEVVNSANYQAAKAMLSAPPPKLPNISIAQPKPLPKIAIAKPKPLPKITIAKYPSAIAPKTVNPQKPSSINLQGGGFGLQGGGIRLQ